MPYKLLLHPYSALLQLQTVEGYVPSENQFLVVQHKTNNVKQDEVNKVSCNNISAELMSDDVGV